MVCDFEPYLDKRSTWKRQACYISFEDAIYKHHFITIMQKTDIVLFASLLKTRMNDFSIRDVNSF